MNVSSHLLTLVLIAVCTAGVTACEQEASTTIARSTEDGERIDKSWVRTWKDRARFECVASTSGACRILVFVSECPGPACRTRVLRDFALRAGETIDLLRLPAGFRYCLSHSARPVAPACRND